MPSSPYIKPIRWDGNEQKPLKSAIVETSALWQSIETDWSNPHSYNRLTEEAFAKVFVELAEKEKMGQLPKGTHVLLTGYHLDYKHAEQFGEFLKELFPNLRIEWVHPNDWLKKPDREARKHAVTKDTIVIAISRSGGAEFPMNMLSDLKTRVNNIFAVTGGEHGDLDTVIAAMLGQGYGANDPLACRTFVTGQPRPQRQALVSSNHMATTQTLNHMAMGLVRALRNADPTGEPLGLEYTEEDMDTIASYSPGLAMSIALHHRSRFNKKAFLPM